MTRFARRDVAIEMRQRSERNVITLHLIAGHELVQGGYRRPMPAYEPLDETWLGEALSTALLAVAGTDAPHQRQIARFAERCGFGVALVIDRGQCMDDFHGKADTEESTDCDRVTGTYQSGGLTCHHNLSGLARSRRWNDCYAHRHLPYCRPDGRNSNEICTAIYSAAAGSV